MVSQVGAIQPTVREPRNSAIAVRTRLAMPGTIRYVHSGTGSSSGLGTFDAPYATIDQAINASGSDDVLHVLPGHAEEISLATEFVPDVDGLSIIGHGRGARRPTITFTDTTGNIPLSGDAILLENLLLTISGTKDVVTGLTVTGVDAHLKDIEMRQPTATDEFVDAITLTGADRIFIEDFVYNGVAQGGSGQTAIHITDAVARPHFQNLWIVGDFATGAIQNEGAAMVDVLLEHLIIQNIHASAACLTVHANTTGVLDYARFRVSTDNEAVFLAALTASNKLQIFDLRIVNADGEVGVPGPVSELDNTDDSSAENTWGSFSVAED